MCNYAAEKKARYWRVNSRLVLIYLFNNTCLRRDAYILKCASWKIKTFFLMKA